MNPERGRRIVLLTGATDGLGRALARELATETYVLIVHGRDQAKLAALAAELGGVNPRAQIFTYRADFAALTDVAALAKVIETDFPRLDVLINNAGIGSTTSGEGRRLSLDGYELRFAVNYLAPFALTARLLPLLRESASARIVNVASIGQAALDFHDVMLEHGYDGTRAYRQSKLAQIAFTFELAQRLSAQNVRNVSVNALHPSSLMPTKIVFESFGYTLSTLEQGVEATLRLAVDPALEGITGKYYDVLSEARVDAQAYDAAARRQLWELSEELIARGLHAVQPAQHSDHPGGG